MMKYVFSFVSANDMYEMDKSYKNDYLPNHLNNNMDMAKYEMNICNKTISTNHFDVMEQLNDFLMSTNDFANNYSSFDETLHTIEYGLTIND